MFSISKSSQKCDRMKVVIVITALLCYVLAQTTSGPQTTRSATDLKSVLLQRAAQLDLKVKTEIEKLVSEGRKHLTVSLKEEQQRVETIVNDLQKATDVFQLSVIETELIDIEYRVDNEVNILKRETGTEEILLNNTKILKEWVTEEINKLQAIEGTEDEKRKAQEAVLELQHEEQTLEQLAQRLTSAQTEREIESLEVELRALEVRLYETLRALHFEPSTKTPITTPVIAPTTKVPNTRLP